MTVNKTGAPSTYAKSWNQINWKLVEAHVYQMQMRIAKSIREGRWGKAKALQHLLSRSFYGKLWAVKRILIGASPEILLNKIKPDLEQFLSIRGLTLSKEKTKLSHLSDEFNFLGFNVRKYNQKLLIQPEDGKTQTLLARVRDFLNSHRGIPFHVMLIKLNSIIRGWAYTYRRVVAKARMGYIDNRLYFLVRKWL